MKKNFKIFSKGPPFDFGPIWRHFSEPKVEVGKQILILDIQFFCQKALFLFQATFQMLDRKIPEKSAHSYWSIIYWLIWVLLNLTENLKVINIITIIILIMISDTSLSTSNILIVSIFSNTSVVILIYTMFLQRITFMWCSLSSSQAPS